MEVSGFRVVEVGGCFRFLACGGFSCAYLIDYGGSRLVFKVPNTLRNYVERGVRPTATRGLDSFRNELDVLMSLNHPNVVRLLGYGVDFPVLVYEYGEATLRDLMVKGVNESDCLRYASGVAEAIRFIHSRGVVHGDVKPENILIVNGVARLTDFNTATRLLATASSSRLTTCTTGYCAPEQIYADLRREALSRGFENRIDIYQLGNIMLECLTGRTINGDDALDEARVNEALNKVSNEDVRELLRQMLNYRPGERLSSEEVAKQIEAIMEGRGATQAKAVKKPPVKKGQLGEELRAKVVQKPRQPSQLDKELLEAAEYGDAKKVKTLLEAGADPNTKDEYGSTPLHWAALKGHLDVVELLLKHGADPNVKDEDGSTPLHDAAWNGHADVVELLLKHGADPNVKDEDGSTPLHDAAWNGHADVVELLLKHGADPNTKNEYGKTPLHRAAMKGHADVVELLLKHGADPNTNDKYGKTPLHRAAEDGLAKVVKVLLEHGADPNTNDKDGKTPLDIAKGDARRVLEEWLNR
ncbi:hypothetical protein GCM10007981_04580 [Thermocladium modestius]|uniref:Protein kinase domain-containing protein n=1 Tax=Thermocladium modestius TaxID=62609 RepID=A0A830GUD5_9CREN|nr:hypothetical protein GCM10007981_04580 [Thermocladium modestius]